MEFSKSITNDAQVRRYSIATTSAGWEVREERNGEVVKRVECKDWHRVERARRTIVMEMQELRSQGWAES